MKIWSNNGEDIWEEEQELIIERVLDDFPELKSGELVQIYEGEVSALTHDTLIQTYSVDGFIDGLKDDAFGEYGESADLYLDDMDSEKTKALRKIVVDFMDKNIKQPKWRAVNNIKKIKVKI